MRGVTGFTGATDKQKKGLKVDGGAGHHSKQRYGPKTGRMGNNHKGEIDEKQKKQSLKACRAN